MTEPEILHESENFCENSYTEMYYNSPPSVRFRILKTGSETTFEIDCGAIKLKLSAYQYDNLKHFLEFAEIKESKKNE